jgi:hypothetical protein
MPDKDTNDARIMGAVIGKSRCQCHAETNDVINCSGAAHCLEAQNALQTDLTLCFMVPVGLTDKMSKDFGSMPYLCKAKALPGIDSASTNIDLKDCPSGSLVTPIGDGFGRSDAWKSRCAVSGYLADRVAVGTTAGL